MQFDQGVVPVLAAAASGQEKGAPQRQQQVARGKEVPWPAAGSCWGPYYKYCALGLHERSPQSIATRGLGPDR